MFIRTADKNQDLSKIKQFEHPSLPILTTKNKPRSYTYYSTIISDRDESPTGAHKVPKINANHLVCNHIIKDDIDIDEIILLNFEQYSRYKNIIDNERRSRRKKIDHTPP